MGEYCYLTKHVITSPLEVNGVALFALLAALGLAVSGVADICPLGERLLPPLICLGNDYSRFRTGKERR